jgi:cell cycle arrest protein BUB2
MADAKAPGRATAASQNSSDAAEVTAHHLLYESTLPPSERVARLRRVAVTDGLDANTRPLAWTLLLGCGRMEARRYSNLCDGLSDDAQKIRDDARRTFRADDSVRQKVRDAQIVRCVTALARSRQNEVSNGANRSAVAACFLYALPSELEAFACFEKLAELCPRYFTPTLDGCVVGAALVDHILRCISPDIHGTLLGDSLLLEDDARTPVEDLVAYPLLASLFTCVPPLDEVAVLWDATFALGGHFPVLCVVALILERYAAGDTSVARLQPRRLAPLDARRIVARACAVAPRVPRSFYDVLERHARDVSVDRAVVAAAASEAPRTPPTPSRKLSSARKRAS